MTPDELEQFILAFRVALGHPAAPAAGLGDGRLALEAVKAPQILENNPTTQPGTPQFTADPRTACEMFKPYEIYWTEENTSFQQRPVNVRHSAIMIPLSGTPIVKYVNCSPDTLDVTRSRVYTARNGICIFPRPGNWYVNLPQAGSAPAQVGFVVLDVADPNLLLPFLLALGGTMAEDLVRWGGAPVTAAFQTGQQASNEANAGPQIRAVIAGLDASQAGGSQIQTIAARTGSSGLATSLMRLLVDSFIRAIDAAAGTFNSVLGSPETSGSGTTQLVVAEGRKSGFFGSRLGRRYTFGTADITGVAAATALTLTAPTWLLVAGATNEQILRRLVISLPLIGTSTTFQCLVKTDTADRFSAGGTTRTPATVNPGNAVAWSGARSLETPTATAEGGGTRRGYVKTGNITSGSTIVFDFEDELIIPASGSGLIYVVTATAGATVHVDGQLEDANVQ